MNRTEYEAFKTAFADALDGLTHPSSGPSDRCAHCCETYDVSAGDFHGAAGPVFSSAPCDICRSVLGGNRFPVHAIDPRDNSTYHFDACNDCVYYLEHGCLDDCTMTEIASHPVGTTDVEPDDDDECPLCGGPGTIRGKMCRRLWLRCRNCGHHHSREV